jgi:hypothetical protein
LSEHDDPELVIRHVRLCECGRPAGHNSVCLSNSAERQWVAVEAEERRDHSDGRKRRIANDRRAAQARMSDWELVLEAREAEFLLSTVGAASTGPTQGGESQRVGPSTQLLEQDPRWRLAKHQLRRAAEQLLDLAEEIRGHGIAATATVQLGEHKDAEILKCVGLKPREVVHHLGKEVAGGTRTVERVREAAGDCRWCGKEWPK